MVDKNYKKKIEAETKSLRLRIQNHVQVWSMKVN